MSGANRANFPKARANRQTVGTPGTPEPLTGPQSGATFDLVFPATFESTALRVPVNGGITIRALDTNSGAVYVGDDTVSASTGFELNPGEQVDLSVARSRDLFVDADSAGDGVHYLASINP